MIKLNPMVEFYSVDSDYEPIEVFPVLDRYRDTVLEGE